MANPLPLAYILEGQSNWAETINANFAIIAAHSHSNVQGTGYQIPLTVVSCVTDVNPVTTGVNSFNIQQLSYIDFNNLTTNFIQRNTLFVQGNELYYTNSINNPVKITENGNLYVKIIGGGGFSGGLPAAGASVTYNSGTDIYEFLGNSGSACTLNVGNIFATTLNATTIASSTSINFNAINISNLASAANGSYLLFESTPYNPQLSLVSITNFYNGINGGSYLLQTNFTQTFIETSYSTDMFAIIVGIFAYTPMIYPAASTTWYITTPHGFMSGQNGYLINLGLGSANLDSSYNKGNNFFFSLYNRDGQNLPPTYNSQYNTTIGATIQFNFGNSYNSNMFTPLIMRNTLGFEI